MHLINLKKNISLFNNSSILVVNNNSENLLTYIAKLVDNELNKKLTIIDPKISNNSYRDIHSDTVKIIKKYNQTDISTLIEIRDYRENNEGLLMILNNCFSCGDNLFLYETNELFRRSKRMNIQLIVTIKKLDIPHRYYSYFDFIIINNAKKHVGKLSMHFPINESVSKKITELDGDNYLFIDNRSGRGDNNIYYRWNYGEINQIEDPEHISLPDGTDGCCICMEDYINGDVMIECRSCNNYGHQHCLMQWYEHNISCPLCRGNSRLNKTFVFVE